MAARMLRLLLTAATLLCLPLWDSAAASPGAPRGWRAYPNPFTTRFRIALPDSTIMPPAPEMRIRVFDMRGQLVRHWLYVLPAGGHEFVIDWDGQTQSGSVAPSGWYIFDIRYRNYPADVRGVRFKMLRLRGALNTTYDWQSF